MGIGRSKMSPGTRQCRRRKFRACFEKFQCHMYIYMYLWGTIEYHLWPQEAKKGQNFLRVSTTDDTPVQPLCIPSGNGSLPRKLAGNGEWGMAGSLFWIGEWGMRFGEWGMGNEIWGMGNDIRGMENQIWGMGYALTHSILIPHSPSILERGSLVHFPWIPSAIRQFPDSPIPSPSF